MSPLPPLRVAPADSGGDRPRDVGFDYRSRGLKTVAQLACAVYGGDFAHWRLRLQRALLGEDYCLVLAQQQDVVVGYGKANVCHPIMFRADDPVRARVRQLALSLPSSAEKISHGRPSFYTTKIFAYYGGSVKVDGIWVEHEQSLLVLPDQSERTALLADSRAYVPATSAATAGSASTSSQARGSGSRCEKLIDSSYRNTAARRLLAELDAD